MMNASEGLATDGLAGNANMRQETGVCWTPYDSDIGISLA